MALPTPTDSKPELYADQSSLETPAVVVDVDVMEENLQEYAEFAATHDVSLRSHTKTHKIPEIAHRQHEMTEGGILCQTLSEAEVMAQNGINDIYLSYMVVTESKLRRLVRLAEKVPSFATTVDCPGNVDPLQAVAAEHDVVVDVVLEVDLGLERVGTPPGRPTLEVAQYVRDQPNLRIVGVMGYEGHIGYGSEEPLTSADFDRQCKAVMDDLAATVDLLETNNIPIGDVKVGSTATSRYSAKHPVVTEINPGMYIFNDANLVKQSPDVEPSDCALSVVTTVISKPSSDRIVVDAGSKAISLDIDVPPFEPHLEGVQYYNASEEHGWIDISDCPEEIAVGDRLSFVVPHVCTTVNLHDTLVGVRDGRIAEVWSIQGRGKVK
jgi:D-serine deaminase-like pyridoxal phosphate-dependent protein